MKKMPAIIRAFVDIGGVMVADRWNHSSRRLAAKELDLDWEEMDARHNQAFGTCELGKAQHRMRAKP